MPWVFGVLVVPLSVMSTATAAATKIMVPARNFTVASQVGGERTVVKNVQKTATDFAASETMAPAQQGMDSAKVDGGDRTV